MSTAPRFVWHASLVRARSGKEARMQTMLLEIGDVAKALGVTPARVRDLATEGRLPIAARTPRGTRLFEPAAIEIVRLQREAAAEERRSR
jgi:hypothetical protein